MKKLYFLILLFILIFITSCDELDVINPDTVYKEYIVVRAELNALSNFEGIAFTKTLPLNEPYDTNKAFLRNVTAYLKIDGIRIIPLHYFQGGIYKPYGNVFIVPGGTYELFAMVESNLFMGLQRFPENPK